MKEKIETPLAPAASGTYSQAIKVGKTIYLAGQIPLDPKTMTLIGEDVSAQIHQAFKNLEAVSKASGGDLNNIVRLTVYLIDLVHFPIVNDVMKEFFNEPYPARTTFQVSALPKAAQIEVDAIMVLN